MKTGAILNTPDNRDIAYRDVARSMAAVTTLPDSYKTDISNIEVLDQGPLGTCVSHATAYVKAFQEGKTFSRRFNYANARARGVYDAVQEGLNPRDAAKVVSAIGALVGSDYDDNTLDHTTYCDTKFTQKITSDPFRYISGYTVIKDGDTDSIKLGVIRDGLVTVTLPYAKKSWMKNGVVKPVTTPEGFHRITIYGYETKGDDVVFFFLNSWGKSWGDGGCGKFNANDFKGKIYDAMVFTHVPDSMIEDARATLYRFTLPMKFKDRSPAVAKLQERLWIEGTYKYPEFTGYYGEVTRQAVKDFQAQNGLKSDGIAGKKTIEKLNEVKKKASISERGAQFIKSFESLHDGNAKTPILEPKKDPVGVWTLGWGATTDANGNAVVEGTHPITREMADWLFSRDIQRFELAVSRLVQNAVLNQNQYDALVSLAYNIGEGNFAKSTILKTILSKGVVTREMFLRHNKARDQKTKKLIELPGLTRRRNAEYDLYIS